MDVTFNFISFQQEDEGDQLQSSFFQLKDVLNGITGTAFFSICMEWFYRSRKFWYIWMILIGKLKSMGGGVDCVFFSLRLIPMTFSVVFHHTELNEIEPNAFLSPFLEVVRSEDTTGPITGLALTSINKFLSYGLVGKFEKRCCFYALLLVSCSPNFPCKHFNKIIIYFQHIKTF